MQNLSMVQALSIWSELEAAYYGKNGFGGDTAEIYAYRLMPMSPSFDHRVEVRDEFNAQATRSLIALVEHFEETHECAVYVVLVDGYERVRKCLKQEGRSFEHRIHLHVSHTHTEDSFADGGPHPRPRDEEEHGDGEKPRVVHSRALMAYLALEGGARERTDAEDAVLDALYYLLTDDEHELLNGRGMMPLVDGEKTAAAEKVVLVGRERGKAGVYRLQFDPAAPPKTVVISCGEKTVEIPLAVDGEAEFPAPRRAKKGDA